jgi:hypothetical protein
MRFEDFCSRKIMDKKVKLSYHGPYLLTGLNVAEGRLQVLYENEKENTKFHHVHLQEVLILSVQKELLLLSTLVPKHFVHMCYKYGEHLHIQLWHSNSFVQRGVQMQWLMDAMLSLWPVPHSWDNTILSTCQQLKSMLHSSCHILQSPGSFFNTLMP